LYWDNTNNRLGINNSSPVDDLHVKGTGVLQGVFESTTTDGGISIVSSTGQDYGLHSLDDGGFAIYDRTDIRYPLKINTDGEVGIGIASPESQLHVAGGNWDLSSTEGDLKVGDSNYRMKVGVATDGGGAGTVRIRADGGTDRLILGSGDEDKMFVHEDGVKFGANGVSIAEIVELTGYTDSEDPGTSWLTTGVYYLNPAWSGTNTYVLSCDVSYGGCSEIWEGMGAGHPDNYSNWYMTISADGGVCISITTHNSSFYRNVPYRIVIMRKG